MKALKKKEVSDLAGSRGDLIEVSIESTFQPIIQGKTVTFVVDTVFGLEFYMRASEFNIYLFCYGSLHKNHCWFIHIIFRDSFNHLKDNLNS